MCSSDRWHEGNKTDQLDDENEILPMLGNEIMLSARHDFDAGSQHNSDGPVVKVAGNRSHCRLRYSLETASSAKSGSNGIGCRRSKQLPVSCRGGCKQPFRQKLQTRETCQGCDSTVSGR